MLAITQMMMVTSAELFKLKKKPLLSQRLRNGAI